MTPYVFFLDIDDTILYDGAVSSRVIRAMAEARRRGHFVYINTGRAPSFLEAPLVSLPVDGFVCGCGSYVLQNGTVLFRAEYPTEALIRWVRKLSSPGDPGFVIEGEKRIFRYRNSYWRPRPEWILGETPEELLAYLRTDTVVKASICNDIDPTILPGLKKDFHVIYHPTEHYTECCPKGCSKAGGMEIIMKHHGLDLSRSVAIGDSENDLDMIDAAGIGIVMGQAREVIKKHADRITAPVTEDGAALAIEELIREE